MYTSILGKTGITVPRLGFGAMRLPLNGDGSINVEKTSELVDYCLRNGVNYFDTAYNYHDGKSQVVMGELLKKYPRDSYLFANKLPVWLCFTPDDCREYFEQQLKTCQTDYFDFYLMHSMNTDRWKRMKEIGAAQVMQQYKEQGKIRALGFSYHGEFNAFVDALDSFDWDFVQIQTNYVDDVNINAGAFWSAANERGIPCVIMEPVRGGALANLSPEAQAELDAYPGSGAYSPAGWAFRWCMALDDTPLILSGMTTLEQVKENIELFSTAQPVNAEEKAMLERVGRILISHKTVPCTRCGYCTSCPAHVHIPDIFHIYNQLKAFGNAFRAKLDYSLVSRAHSAKACVNCGKCVPMCPQDIHIPGELAKVHETIRNLNIALPVDFEPID